MADVAGTNSVEWCYLLGDFGVDVRGRHAQITAPVRPLAFGDWTRQGLPFYTGKVTYHCTLPGTGRETFLRATGFVAPLLTVLVNGTHAGGIAFAPYELAIGPGRHLDRYLWIVGMYIKWLTVRRKAKQPMNVARGQGEVANGGFGQFFANIQGDCFIEEARNGFVELGAHDLAEMFESVLAYFRQNRARIDAAGDSYHTRNTRRSCGMSRVEENLNNVTSRFLARMDDFYVLRRDYILRHLDVFCDAP